MPRLTTTDHSRDSAGLTYIYPVISRRAGGLSIGVNLNPNNACNWRCVYCQVPGLSRGAAPDIDLPLLRTELTGLLNDVLHGDFYERFQLPADRRIIRDIAISGNGEPTGSPEFGQVVELIGETVGEFGLAGKIKLVLITNGSLMHRPTVQSGVRRWGELGGEVWFKLDSATEAGIRRINQVGLSPRTVLGRLETCARLCPTRLQTCLFAFDGQPPSAGELQAYLEFLAELRKRAVPIRGVLLYGLARPSMQAEAPRLSALPSSRLEEIAERIRALGLDATVSG
jgi:wyosine [tRNA(Phe)-imidazoG37] synthetase (radical SAM superfamily)